MKKYEGWERTTDKGNTLKVVEVTEGKGLLVECSVCSEDKELHPEPFLVKDISYLKSRIPCPCSKGFQWSAKQRSIQVERLCEKHGYVFEGFVGEFKGNKTYLTLYNPLTDNRWETCNIANFLNNKRKDPKTRGTREIPAKDRILQVESILKGEGNPQTILTNKLEKGLKPSNTKFTWLCKKGHECQTSFNNFINHGQRCRTCYHKDNDYVFKGSYYPSKYDKVDYLYVIKVEYKGTTIFKVGRSFDPTRRVYKHREKIDPSAHIIYMEKSTHIDTVLRERRLLKILSPFNYYDGSFEGWTECFTEFDMALLLG